MFTMRVIASEIARGGAVMAEIAVVGGAYVVIKLAAFVTAGRRPEGRDLAAYLCWPGVDPSPFTRAREVPGRSVRVAAAARGAPERSAGTLVARGAPGRSADALVVRGALVMAAGLVGCAALAVAAPHLPRDAVGWLGIVAILTTIHLGLSDVLSGWLGRHYPLRRLFVDPLVSVSLREFWSLRWNTAYVEMNRLLFRPPARRWFGRYANAALFALSGLLHEVAISVPVRDGFGGPTVYFLLHAAAVHAETRLGLVRWPRPLARLWTWGWLLLPLPLLFHAPFRNALVVPLFTVWSAP